MKNLRRIARSSAYSPVNTEVDIPLADHPLDAFKNVLWARFLEDRASPLRG